MPTNESVQEWLQVRRMLMDLEAAFTDLALKAAAGEVGLSQLGAERERLMQTRAACTAAYERAFPKPLQQRTEQ